MVGRRWTYALAAATGGLAGLLLFLLKQFFAPAVLADQLIELCIMIALGAAVMLAFSVARNHWWERANRRHDLNRAIDIVRD
jgi:hypothetical protein